MDDEYLVCSRGGERVDTGRHGSVEPEPRLLEKESSVRERPRGHLGVVADNSGHQRHDRAEHVLSHRAGEMSPLSGIQDGREAPLGGIEALDGDERHATGQLRKGTSRTAVLDGPHTAKCKDNEGLDIRRMVSMWLRMLPTTRRSQATRR